MMSLVRLRTMVQGFLFGSLLVTLYYSAYVRLIGYDWAREDYNYCYLIPFVVLYLIWEKKDKWFIEASVLSWGGLLALLPGILLFWIGELAGEFFALYISSWLVVTGLLWGQVGGKKLKIMAFPLFTALFLFPLPTFINTKLTFNLKLLSSEIGIKLIQFFGMSAYREGNIIDLGFTQLQVVDACSGLRYLIPLFLMGVLVAHYYRSALWKRVVIVFSSIPLSIITNSLRIAATALLYPFLGRAAAEGFFHEFSGWVIFMASFGVMLFEIWILRRIMPRPDEHFMGKQGASLTSAEKDHPELAETIPSAMMSARAFFLQPQFVVFLSLLVITAGVHSVVDVREKQPVSRPFNTFPLHVGEWEGTRQVLDRMFTDTLEFTDYTLINYAKRNSPPINLYVAYYESQRKGKSIHSPETCLPGSGWCFTQAGTVAVLLSGGNQPFSVMRALMEKNDQKQLVYFWFNERGRTLTNAYEMKIYNLLDALTKRRTDGALIRVITPISSLERVEDADRRLQSFINDIAPALNEFIPGSPA